ncbi:MAG: NFACT family protein [Lachnospiraceae bacterium]|nr:NFACT family protein [Lachnospiraceae bacterium]
MAFDGLTIANIAYELNRELTGARLYKIAQPEADELLLTLKTTDGQKRLLISADASLPLVYLTDDNKPSPMTAPNFCMLLRKHLQNGRITGISQPGLERILHIDVEHLDEMGDLCRKTLVIEIMGKHSNVIFVNGDGTILDSIKHVSAAVSSVREVLPGKPYFVANTQDKLDLFAMTEEEFRDRLASKPLPAYKALYGSVTGISPILAQELCHRAGIDGDRPTAAMDDAAYAKLFQVMTALKAMIENGSFSPCVAYDGKHPAEYAAIPLTIYGAREDGNVPPSSQTVPGEGYPSASQTVPGEGYRVEPFPSMSALLEYYYAEKNAQTRIHQRSADLRRVVQTILERNVKKYDLQLQQIKDTEKRETYRIYGELLNTYGYNAAPGAKSLEALNYYTNETIQIPLDPTLTAKENAQRYFDRYGKMKRTYEALTTLTEEVKAEIDHLESIATSLEIAQKEEDLTQIKEELIESGYIHRKGPAKKVKVTSKPFHYVSSDGFDIYVGKNNFQNDQLTFQFATGNDWWFHAKKIPGSHVIVKTEGKELPDRTFEEAARLAAYYSKGREQDKVEIDYVQKKHVKKPSGAKPGFVVYYTNFSMAVPSDITGLIQQ